MRANSEVIVACYLLVLESQTNKIYEFVPIELNFSLAYNVKVFLYSHLEIKRRSLYYISAVSVICPILPPSGRFLPLLGPHWQCGPFCLDEMNILSSAGASMAMAWKHSKTMESRTPGIRSRQESPRGPSRAAGCGRGGSDGQRQRQSSNAIRRKRARTRRHAGTMGVLDGPHGRSGLGRGRPGQAVVADDHRRAQARRARRRGAAARRRPAQGPDAPPQGAVMPSPEGDGSSTFKARPTMNERLIRTTRWSRPR